MRAWGIGVALVVLLQAAPAGAVTTTVTFDDKANDTAVPTVPGATLSTASGAPKVFTPTHVSTYSSPRALRTPTSTGGIDTMTITFDTPKSSVSARVGVDRYAMGEFGTCWELKAFNGATTVATSGEICPAQATPYENITRFIKAQSASTNITRATLRAGAPGIPSLLDLDNLVFTDDAPPPLPAPTVSISDPAGGAVFDTINAVRVSGRVDAAAGVNRFCLTTSTAATIPDDCGARGSVDGSGNFTNQRGIL